MHKAARMEPGKLYDCCTDEMVLDPSESPSDERFSVRHILSFETANGKARVFVVLNSHL